LGQICSKMEGGKVEGEKECERNKDIESETEWEGRLALRMSPWAIQTLLSFKVAKWLSD
jgi:hypothetical protein